jgi:CDP-glucose 4,6-dehydratase
MTSNFWDGRRVLVTGHTGFKGAWLCEWLLANGASVYGFALPPEGRKSLFEELGLASRIDHVTGDICEEGAISRRVKTVRPQIVFHLAAQSLVRLSYTEPVKTWATNVMGTVNLLDALANLDEICSTVMTTTDKVYENREWAYGYRENDRLGGSDPYSASKTAMELAIGSWRKSFGPGGAARFAVARSGNVIGGGDWARDRIMPDLARSFAKGLAVELRNPSAVRPWQHVLDPLSGYLLLAERLSTSDDEAYQSEFNFGPAQEKPRTVGELVEEAIRHWRGSQVSSAERPGPPEAMSLTLSIEKARHVLDWSPRWNFARAVAETVDWYRASAQGVPALQLTQTQIAAFEKTP